MFTPDDRPRLSVTVGGTLVAVGEATRITILAVDGLYPRAELPVDGDAVTEHGWLGDRLLVLRRFADHSIAQLWDAPAQVAELHLGARLRLAATAGDHALVAGALGSAVLTAHPDHLTVREWPRPIVPDASGAAADWFAVATRDAIEAWDPARTAVARRTSVSHDEPIFIGGTLSTVWRVTQAAPSVIEVLAWRGAATERFDAGAPITQVASHPHSSWLACLDADGRVHVVGRGELAIPAFDRVESIALSVGDDRAVLLAARGRAPLALIELGEPRRVFADPGEPRRAVADPGEPRRAIADPGEPRRAVADPGEPGLVVDDPSSLRRAFDDHGGALASLPDAVGDGAFADAAEPSWRDALAGWARSIAAGLRHAPPPSLEVSSLAAQLGLRAELAPALILLYGAHLAGADGASLSDIARVLGTWDETLGRGELVTRGLATIDLSRMHLGRAVQRRLDELP